LNFLNIPSDAKSASLGFSAMTHAQPTSSILFNPATLGSLSTMKISLNHLEWIGGLRKENLSIGAPLGPGVLAGSIDFFHLSKFDELENGTPTGNTLNFFDMYLSLGYGIQVLKGKIDLSLGASFMWIQESIAGLNESVMSGNFGALTRFSDGPGPRFAKGKALTRTQKKNFKIGIAGRNFGQKTVIGTRTSPLPWAIGVGFDYTPTWWTRIILEGNYGQGRTLTMGFGLEGLPFFLVRPRFGFKISAHQKFLTAGLGVKISTSSQSAVNLDYAISSIPDGGLSHWISLTLQGSAARKSGKSPQIKPNGQDENPHVSTNLPDKTLFIRKRFNKTQSHVIRVTIFPFANLSKSDKYRFLTRTIGDTIRANLKPNPDIALEGRDRITRLYKTLDLSRNHQIELSTACVLANDLGADLIIVGEFSVVKDDIFIDFNIIAADDRKIIFKGQHSGPGGGNIFSLLDSLSKEISGHFRRFRPTTGNNQKK